MAKNPTNVPFTQPSHGETGHSSGKNASKVGFKQNPHRGAAGGTSSKKNAGKVGFSQPVHGKGGTSSAKNASKVGFDQPNHGGSAKMPVAEDKQGVVQAKAKGWTAPDVAPPAAKFTSISSLMSYRKQKYGA